MSDSARDRDFDALVASVANGDPIDWPARVAAGGEDRGRLEALEGIARLAAFHHTLQTDGAGAGEPLPFERWGDLVLLERLGAGAHAEVFRAWDATLQRDVALKLMRADPDGAIARDRTPALLEEGRAAARVRHANVVTVYGVATHADRVGLWMELVRGPALDRWVERHGPLSIAEAARLGTEIGSALAAVHEAGLLHRDLKPANVVRDAEGRWVLADFGLGVRESFGPGEPLSGTPMYMAPECLDGRPASERSEVYALGLVVWFALAGRHPYETHRLLELRALAGAGPPALPRDTGREFPAGLEAVLHRAAAARPEQRFASASAFAEALAPWRAATPDEAPARAGRGGSSRFLWLAAAAVVLIAGTLTVAALRRNTARATRLAPAAPSTPAALPYDVEASLVRYAKSGTTRLAAGDRVAPGDRLSLEFHSTRPAWVYVLDEDDAGERYLLFPQPLFDLRNPLPPDSAVTLPGSIGGAANGWTVTSRGGHERFLIVASPAPIAALEAELASLPAPEPDRPIRYARVSDDAIERLRGVGGLEPLPASGATQPPDRAFDRFRTLAEREAGVRGVWVREIVLQNP